MPAGGGPRRIRVLLAVAAAALAADVITKVVVVGTLSGHPPIRLLGGVLTLQLLRNSGAAFNIGTSMTVVFTLIAVGVIVFILRTARKLRSLPWAVTLGLLLGGATGNLVDRLARSPGPLRGDVVDWIQLPHWPVFNLADASIVCGGALAILLSIRGIRIDGTRDGDGDEAPGNQPPGEQPEPGATGPGATAPGATAPGATAPGATATGRTEPEGTVPGRRLPGGTVRDGTRAARTPGSGVGDSGARHP